MSTQAQEVLQTTTTAEGSTLLSPFPQTLGGSALAFLLHQLRVGDIWSFVELGRAGEIKGMGRDEIVSKDMSKVKLSSMGRGVDGSAVGE